MIVYDLNVMSIPVLPSETDSPLVIDTNAILSGPVAAELLKAISPWHPKIR